MKKDKTKLFKSRSNRVLLFSAIGIILSLIFGYRLFESVIIYQLDKEDYIQINEESFVLKDEALSDDQIAEYNSFKQKIIHSKEYDNFVCPPNGCGDEFNIQSAFGSDFADYSIQVFLRYETAQKMIKDIYLAIGIIIFGIILIAACLIKRWHLFSAIFSGAYYLLLIFLVEKNYISNNGSTILENPSFLKFGFYILILGILLANWILNFKTCHKDKADSKVYAK